MVQIFSNIYIKNLNLMAAMFWKYNRICICEILNRNFYTLKQRFPNLFCLLPTLRINIFSAPIFSHI
uniref:Uncharacterized protein n=1 Tax=Papilio xuthus TaxID=66420 RepID=I4DLL6_PAPXU|nr:unknown unsecreted protein [Papilio xuthus]